VLQRLDPTGAGGGRGDFYEESQKDHWGIVTAAVRLVEEFNA